MKHKQTALSQSSSAGLFSLSSGRSSMHVKKVSVLSQRRDEDFSPDENKPNIQNSPQDLVAALH